MRHVLEDTVGLNRVAARHNARIGLRLDVHEPPSGVQRAYRQGHQQTDPYNRPLHCAIIHGFPSGAHREGAPSFRVRTEYARRARMVASGRVGGRSLWSITGGFPARGAREPGLVVTAPVSAIRRSGCYR